MSACYRARGVACAVAVVAALAGCGDLVGHVNHCPILFSTGNWYTGNEGSFEYWMSVDRHDNRCPIGIVQPGEMVFNGGLVIGTKQWNHDWVPTEVADLRVFNAASTIVGHDRSHFARTTWEQIEADIGVGYPAASGHGTFNESDRLDLRILDYCCLLPQVRGRIELRLTYERDTSPRIRIYAGYGDGIPPPNAIITWDASSPSGGRPHVYNWYRDGEFVGSGDRYQGFTGTQPFELRADYADIYGRTTSDALYVDVDGVQVSVQGPSTVWLTHGGGTWSASGRGGITPYTFSWFVDGAFVGSGPSWTGYPGEGNHTMRVEISDVRGRSSTAEMEVFGIGNEGCSGELMC